MILVTQRNPFDPGDRTIDHLSAPCTIADLAPVTTQPFVMLHRGAPVLRADWATTSLAEGDIVCAVYLPAGGGGGGKNPLRTVLMIAVMAVAAATGNVVAGLKMFAENAALGAAAGAAAAGVVGAAGLALVNAFMPAPRATSSQQLAQASEASPTYSLTAQGNRARLGSAVPEHFGRVRAFPDFAAQPYTRYRDGKQYLYQLFCLGRGEYTIHDVYVGNSKIGNFEDVDYWVYDPGEAPDAFPDRVITSVEVSNLELEDEQTSLDYFANPAGTHVRAVYVDLVAPNGVYEIEPGDGDISSVEVRRWVRYRATTDAGAPIGDWITAYDYTSNPKSYQKPYRQTIRFTLPASVTRCEVKVRVDTNHRWDRDNMSAQFYWESMKAELRSDNVADYPGVTLLAVQMRADRQLSGAASRRVSVDCTRHLPVYNGSTWTTQATRRAAWAWAYVLRSDNAANLDDDRIDLSHVTWLAGQDLEFNGRFDTGVTCWEALTQIARTMRGFPYQQGGVVRLARDVDQTVPVAMFTDRNIARGSFSLEYLPPPEDSAVAVSVNYMDGETWKPAKVAARWDGEEIDAIDAQVEVDLFGVIDRDIAFAEAFYLARANKYRRRIVRFSTEMEGFIPSPGDLISVSHSMPAWGTTGEVTAWDGATRTATLSNPPDWLTSPLFITLRDRDGTRDGPYGIARGLEDDKAILGSAPSITPDVSGDRERTHYAIGRSNDWSRLALVTAIRPRSDTAVEIEATIDDQRARTAPTAPTPEATDPPPIYQDCAAPGITGLWLSANDDLTVVTAAWTAPDCATHYDVQITEDPADGWDTLLDSTTERQATINNPYGAALQVRARAHGDSVGAWSPAAMLPTDVTAAPVYILNPPTGIIAGAIPGGASVGWTQNPSPRLAWTRVYVSTTDDSTTASLVTQAPAGVEAATLNGYAGDVPLFLWLSSVNAAGLEGALSASVTVTPLKTMEELEGELDETWLTQELQDRLDQIDAPVDGLIDKLADETQARVDALNDVYGDLLAIGGVPFDADQTYAVGDVVTYTDGGLYRCTTAITSTPAPNPTNAAYWEKIGDYAGLGDAIGAHAIAIDDHETRVTDNEGEITALSSSVQALSAAVAPGGNFIEDACFQYGEWEYYETAAGYQLDYLDTANPHALNGINGERVARLLFDGTSPADVNQHAKVITGVIPVEEGKTYQASVYIKAYGCDPFINVFWYSDADASTFISTSYKKLTTSWPATASQAISSYLRQGDFFEAPTGAVCAKFQLRHHALASGQASPQVLFARPMFGPALADQTEFPAWVDGPTPGAISTAIQSIETRTTTNEGDIDTQSSQITALQSSVNTKADSSAVSALDTRVTINEGNISTQSSQITALQSSVNTKADSSAVSALDTRVTTNEGNISTQSSQITTLQSSVNTKADSSAVSALTTRVTDAEGDIDALGQVQETLVASVGGDGNFIEDAIFAYDVAWSAYTTTSGYIIDGVDDSNPHGLTGVDGERTLRIRFDGTAPADSSQHAAVITGIIPVEADRTYQASVYFKGFDCTPIIYVFWYSDADASTGAGISGETLTTHWASGNGLDTFSRQGAFFTAPDGAVCAKFQLRHRALTTAKTNPLAMFARPMFGPAGDSQTILSDWVPGVQPEMFAALERKGMVYASNTGEGTAGARYTVKLRADDGSGGTQAGFGMAVEKEASSGKWVADFRILADRFAILDPADDPEATPATGKYPFIISSGVTYIKQAAIKNADITTLKLAGNAVTVPQTANAAPPQAGTNASYASTTLTLTATTFVLCSATANWLPDGVHPNGRGLTGTLEIEVVGAGNYFGVSISLRSGFGGASSTSGGVTLSSGTYTIRARVTEQPAPGGESWDANYWYRGRNSITVMAAKR